MAVRKPGRRLVGTDGVMVARYRLGRNSIVDHAWEGWLWPAPQSGTELKTLGVGIGVGIGIAIAIGSLVILVLSFTDAA